MQLESSALSEDMWGLYPTPKLFIPAFHAFRLLVPPQDDREPLTWRTAPYPFLYLIPFFFMAYLVRRAHTYVTRLFLLPVVIWATLYCTCRYKMATLYYTTLDWGRIYMALVIIAKALDYAICAKDGRFKVGEQRLPEIFDTPKSLPKAANGTTHEAKLPEKTHFLPQGLRDAFEVAFSLRGIGWDFGYGVYVPPNTKPMERGPFLKATARTFLRKYLIVDISNSLLKMVPGVGTPAGGSMFFPDLPIPARYIVSTAIHTLCGILIMFGMDAVNELCTLVGVGLLGQPPSAWPPLQNKPWRASSLHDLWGKRWHQALRHVFFIYGGFPGYWIGGKTGMVLGTFLASGLYHEIGMQIWFDHRVTLFFLFQGAGTILETKWARRTGKIVSGIYGWLWMIFFMFVLGQLLTDAWCVRGLIGRCVVPEQISIIHLVVLPLIRLLAS